MSDDSARLPWCGSLSCWDSPQFCESRCAYTVQVFEKVALYDLTCGVGSVGYRGYGPHTEETEIVLDYLRYQLSGLAPGHNLEVVAPPNVWGTEDGDPYCIGQRISLKEHWEANFDYYLSLGIVCDSYVYPV